MNKTKTIITTILLAATMTANAAQVHMCKLPDGSVSFSDSGCNFGGDKEARFQLNGADNNGAVFVNENNVGILVDAYERDTRRIESRQRYTAPRSSRHSRRLRERELRMEQGDVKGDSIGSAWERINIRRERQHTLGY